MVRAGRVLGLWAMVMVSAACESGVEPAPGEADPDTFPALSAAETAGLLTDSTTAERGVRSILRSLGIGVYDTAAVRVSPGSAAGPDDFWVYDFLVPTLAGMASAPERSFEAFHAGLAELGLSLDAARLLTLYRDTYADSPDGFLPRLFAALGVDFTAPPAALMLTPLEEWLLYLDGFVPPNPQPTTATALTGREQGAATGSGTGAGAPCAGFDAVRASAWGAVHGTGEAPLAGWVDPVMLSELQLALHTITAEVVPGYVTVHERHPDGEEDPPRDTLTLRARLAFPDLPRAVRECGSGLFSGAVYPNVREGDFGLNDATVWWDLPPLLTEDHGQVRLSDGQPWIGQPDRTNFDGEAEAFFEAREEFARGEGSLLSDQAPVSARFDYRVVLLRMFPLAEPGLMNALPHEVTVRMPANVIAEWHEVEAGIDFQTTITVESGDGMRLAVMYTASGPLARTTSELDDPLLRFEGEFDLIQENVTFDYQVEGCSVTPPALSPGRVDFEWQVDPVADSMRLVIGLLEAPAEDWAVTCQGYTTPVPWSQFPYWAYLYRDELGLEWGLIDFWEEQPGGDARQALHEMTKSEGEVQADTRVEVRWN